MWGRLALAVGLHAIDPQAGDRRGSGEHFAPDGGTNPQPSPAQAMVASSLAVARRAPDGWGIGRRLRARIVPAAGCESSLMSCPRSGGIIRPRCPSYQGTRWRRLSNCRPLPWSLPLPVPLGAAGARKLRRPPKRTPEIEVSVIGSTAPVRRYVRLSLSATAQDYARSA